MEDARVCSFEKSLWTGDAEHYRHLIDEDCVMVVPTPPFVLQGSNAMDAVADTPRWDEVDFSGGHIVRPQEGLIVVAYRANPKRSGGNGYEAYCTSTYRRLAHDEWRVVQHQQMPPL